MGTSRKTQDDEKNWRVSWDKCGQRQSELRRSHARSAHNCQLFGDVPRRWHEAARQRNFSKLDEVKALSREGLTAANYTTTLSTLLMMEQAHESIEIRRFDMFRKRLVKRNGSFKKKNSPMNPYYGVLVNGLSTGELKLMPRDYVILRDLENNYETTTIEFIEGDFVALSRKKLIVSETFWKGRFDIFFVSNGFLYTFYDKGLDRFDSDSSLRARLFQGKSIPSRNCRQRLERYHASADLVLSGDGERFNQFNGAQRQAILNILEARFWPKPYILFGPPGTGKTHTLAEAIAQIYTRIPQCKILYCANSNTCVDQMADRLGSCPLIPPDDTCRLFAGQKPKSIGQRRIVLTTNMKSTSLINVIEFDYVLIDEAGHAHEAESLLPICCLKRSGSLVLAGDPKQLGPVVKCEQASKYGLGVTLLDRLFRFNIYQRDRATGQYDSRYITKLLMSYRCDPRILSISNRLFYDNELRCVNETPRSLLKIMRISNPLQVRFVKGHEEQPGSSSSWRNFVEVDQCVDLIIRLYKMGLTPDQIGVISPYKLQTDEIRENLDRRLESLRAFLEKRFREVEKVIRWRKKERKSTSKSMKDLTFNLERLKLGEVEKFDLEVQHKKRGADGDVVCEWVEQVKEREDRWLCKIDSVDAYQGSECEVIIISTVKTNGKGNHVFVNDARRFNVAISRAKWLVFVIGHKGFLQKQSNWTQFIRHAGKEVSRWAAQSNSDSKHPFKQFRLLF